ncbi:MAG TPA: hypothetical protein VGK89_03420 [Candidatus Eisenbacteria bacterium]|jgi:hypothetical protein
MHRNPQRFLAAALLVAALAAPGAFANPLSPESGPVFTPRVPVSALARPLAFLDPSRLQLSSITSVGSGWGGGMQALQVTRLSYRFDAPVLLSVGIGNAFGPQATGRSSLFLEGLDFAFRPSQNTLFEVRYQNVRSPLQLGTSPYFTRDRGW